MPVHLYEVTTETGMPHLEENLRYATRQERRCLDRHDLSSAFWMLGHASLQDCRLVKTGEDSGSAEPSRQAIVRQALAGKQRASSLTGIG